MKFTNHVGETLDGMIREMTPSSVFILVDDNTSAFVLPRLRESSAEAVRATVITIHSGEINKNLASVSHIWQKLGEGDADRSSLLVNLGGGVVTDMGGFAASTFKRGIRFINIPTTLLAGVDASVGGKNGFNFNGLKNEIGIFREPDGVIVSTLFLETLTSGELLSGYAEMLKHALISSREFTVRLLGYDITDFSSESLLRLLEESVAVKQHFVEADFEDRGLRRVLNFGHTFGHAFESLALSRRVPLPHGYAVAFGMVTALILSRMNLGFPSSMMYQYVDYVKKHYGVFEISCDDYEPLLRFMHHDKKNENNRVNATLLEDIGKPRINVPLTDDDIIAALDIYRDLLNL